MVMVMILIMQDPTSHLPTTGFSQPLAQTPSRKQGTPRLETQVKPTFIVFVVSINTLQEQAMDTTRSRASQSTPMRLARPPLKFDLSAIMDESQAKLMIKMMMMMKMMMMKMMYEDYANVMNTLQAASLNDTPKRMREREEDSQITPAKTRRRISDDDDDDDTPKELELEEAAEKEGDFVYTDYVFPGAVKKAHQGQDCCVIIFELEKQSKGCYRASISDGEDFSKNLYIVDNFDKAEAELVGKISVVNLFATALSLHQKVDYIC